MLQNLSQKFSFFFLFCFSRQDDFHQDERARKIMLEPHEENRLNQDIGQPKSI